MLCPTERRNVGVVPRATSSALLLLGEVGHSAQLRMRVSQAAEYERGEWLVGLLMTVTPTLVLSL